MIKILILLLFMVGCSSGGVHVVNKPTSLDTLSMKSIQLSSELLMPTRMIISDGNIVVYQRRGDDVFVHIDVKNGGQCKVIGKQGRGPKEFLGVDVQSIKPIEGGFVCMEYGGTVKTIMLSDMTMSSEFVYKQGFQPNGIFVGDKYIAANLSTDKSEYISYSPNSFDSREMSSYPQWTSDSGQPLQFIYMKNLVAHPEKDIFAAFYVNFRKMRILDAAGTLLSDVDIQIPNEFPLYSSEDPMNRYLAYASYPTATSKLIYALCYNCSVLSLKTSHPEIHIWDWSGNLKKRYVPDVHLDLFTVDDKRGILYGMNVSQPDKLYYQNL